MYMCIYTCICVYLCVYVCVVHTRMCCSVDSKGSAKWRNSQMKKSDYETGERRTVSSLLRAHPFADSQVYSQSYKFHSSSALT